MSEFKKETAISARGLTIGYPLKGVQGGGGRSVGENWKIVQQDIDFDLYRGELTSLIGLNGAGKSTLIRSLCRFQPYCSGRVELMGRDMGTYSTSEFALTVGVVLTDRTSAGGMTVRELVSLGRQPYTGFFGKLSQEDRKVVDDALESVGIAHKSVSYISELSDGERQRAMIAKALAQQCPIIILDEPTAFLDVTGRIDIMALLHRTAREFNKAIFLSNHDIDNAIMFSDKIMLLSEGQPVCCGAPEDLILDGEMSRFFARRGMNFDVRSGRLSSGVDGVPVGLSGDHDTVRWMANALARNGATPVLPEEGLTCTVVCRSRSQIEVSYQDGGCRVFNGIGPAVENIAEHICRR